MPDLSAVAEVLERLGFEEHTEHPAAEPERVASLSYNGPYVVHGAWQKGDVIVHVEQNTAPSPPAPDGSYAVTTYPPVLVVEDTASGGRLAISFHDLEAFERVLEGERDFNENGDPAL